MELVQQAFGGVSSVRFCEICGRPLSNPTSIAAGMGPICRGKGHSHAGTTEKPVDMSQWGTRIDYMGANGFNGHCYVLVHGNTVIATEAEDDPGVSVTNAVEIIATDVCTRFGILPKDLIFFEHYIHSGSDIGETFDAVMFTDLGTHLAHPKWVHATREQAMAHFTT